jgi:hypothetical protein
MIATSTLCVASCFVVIIVPTLPWVAMTGLLTLCIPPIRVAVRTALPRMRAGA